jgi:glycogen debranching enzyme
MSEWLEADGRGAYASGTVSGIRTRRYHALLMTATTPPTGRVILVNGVEAWLDVGGERVPITQQHYAPGVTVPDHSRTRSLSPPTFPSSCCRGGSPLRAQTAACRCDR